MLLFIILCGVEGLVIAFLIVLLLRTTNERNKANFDYVQSLIKCKKMELKMKEHNHK